MKDYLAGNIYSGGCAFVPAAEYFDGPYGISLPLDSRFFPGTANKMFAERGFQDFYIKDEDVLHVSGCNEVWPGDLDCETKAMVKQVYARDFDLLCKHFGYCDKEENSCVSTVAEMCPSHLAEKRRNATRC